MLSARSRASSMATCRASPVSNSGQFLFGDGKSAMNRARLFGGVDGSSSGMLSGVGLLVGALPFLRWRRRNVSYVFRRSSSASRCTRTAPSIPDRAANRRQELRHVVVLGCCRRLSVSCTEVLRASRSRFRTGRFGFGPKKFQFPVDSSIGPMVISSSGGGNGFWPVFSWYRSEVAVQLWFRCRILIEINIKLF